LRIGGIDQSLSHLENGREAQEQGHLPITPADKDDRIGRPCGLLITSRCRIKSARAYNICHSRLHMAMHWRQKREHSSGNLIQLVQLANPAGWKTANVWLIPELI
jgi:hypothetical protein